MKDLRDHETSQLRAGLEYLRHEQLVLGDEVRQVGLALSEVKGARELDYLVGDLRVLVVKLSAVARRLWENEDQLRELK